MGNPSLRLTEVLYKVMIPQQRGMEDSFMGNPSLRLTEVLYKVMIPQQRGAEDICLWAILL